MSYPINQKINPYQQQAMGLNTPQGQTVAPQAMGAGPNDAHEKIKQNINSNPIVKTAKEDNPLFLFGMMIPIWVGISKVMDKFNAACTGENSILHKIARFGDAIGNKIENKASSKVGGIFSSVAKGIDKHIIKKVSILNSIVHNPSKPEFGPAKVMASGTVGELTTDLPMLFEKFATTSGAEYDSEILKKAGFNSSEAFEAFAKTKKGKFDLAKLKTLGFQSVKEFEELAIVSPEKYDIKKLNALGFKTADEFRAWKKADAFTDLAKHVEDGIKRCDGMKGSGYEDLVKFSQSKDQFFLKKIFLKFGMNEETYVKTVGRIERTMSFTETSNKLKALRGGLNTTKTGKLLSKYFLRSIEGLTNGTAGGKLAISMQAFCFAQAIAKTFDAPKGEKTKTFMENIINDLSMYLFAPLGINLMHKAGGLQYIGMNKTELENYRNELSKFNDEAKKGLLDKKEYAARRQQLKTMLKGETKMSFSKDGLLKTGWKFVKNIVHKPLKFAGRFLTVGLETVRPFTPQSGNKFVNFFKKVPFYTKLGAGFPVRIIAYIGLIAPPLSAIAVKASHAIFGRPTKSILDDEPEKEKELPPLVMPSTPVDTTIATAIQPQSALAPTQTQSVLAQNQAETQPKQTRDLYTTNSLTQKTMIPTDEERKPKRRYIPSSEGVKITTLDPKEQKALFILKESEKAEKRANKFTN